MIVIDTGLPASVLWDALSLSSREGIARLLEEKFRGFINDLKSINGSKVLVGFSVLDPEHELDDLREIQEKYFKGSPIDVLPILQLNGGFRTIRTDLQQVDNEGDVIGSLCPSRGVSFISSLAKESVERFGGFSIDITDIFVFTPKGLTTCVCPICLNEMKSLLQEDGESVIEFVFRGGLKSVVSSKDRGGYRILPVSRLKIVEGIGAGGAREESSGQEIRLSYLFFKARSKLVGKLVVEAFRGVSGYKAVFLQGDSVEAATSVVTEVFLEYIDSSGKDLDVHVYAHSVPTSQGGRATNVGVYNVPKGRYLVNQFSEVLYHYYKLLLATSRYSDEDDSEIDNSRFEMKKRAHKLMSAVSRCWVPSLKKLGELSGDYTIYGLESIQELTNILLGSISLLTSRAERDELLSMFRL